MSRKEIVDYVFKSVENIADCKCVLTYHSKNDTYEKEYEYNTFEIRGRKNWQFGIWIISKDKKEYSVYLFAQHKWYIDKFKPTCSPISFTFDISKTKKSFPVPRIDKNGYEAPNEVWEFGWAIDDIVKSNVLSRVKYYYQRSSFFNFIIGEWWFYAIKNPFNNWYHDYGEIVPLTIAKLLYKIRFGNKIKVNIYSCREFFSPKWDFQIVYNTKDDDEIYRLYHIINKKNNKKLFLPKRIFDFVNVVNALDEKDTHSGFYYNED